MALSAKQGRVVLDSLFWKPGIFNAGVLLLVDGHPGRDSIAIQVREVICLADGIIQEPIWSRLDSLRTTSKTFGDVNFQAIFSPEIFNGDRELSVFIKTNLGTAEFQFDAKALSQLR
jgi:hypothetical protein